MEMVFEDGPKLSELCYGLPGQSLLENKNYSNKRIYGVGQNFYQKEFYSVMAKKANLNASGQKFTDLQETET